ncbi:MAG: response regulator [Candidatus Omnitrophica bacterium]|nr:response regulator [Candidatus Omnitrophota bacterium]
MDKAAKKAVLVVDDEAPVRAMLVKFLKSLQIDEIFEAANGEEALERIRATPHLKLIFMDLKMPKMDGLKTLEAIRAINPNVKIAILTGYPFYENADQATQQWGTFDFITKPIDLDYLERIVSAALSQP